MLDLIGRTIGHFRIVEKIGAGGMGEVYCARDDRLDRDVAIKTILGPVAQDEQRMARFEREAKLLASLGHQNIATLHGLEEHEGQRYLVMELAEGTTLANRIALQRISIDDALDYARQIAEGLEAAHKNGIIHRDLKPANIMVSDEGRIKILDFGLAKGFESPGSSPSTPESFADSPTLTAAVTGTGVLLGTAAYMSPEQARGKQADKRADVWAFGCVLYEMLTGRMAYEGDDASQTMAAILRDDPDWAALPPAAPNQIQRLLKRCLTKDPHDRLHDIADARIEIQLLSADSLSRDELIGQTQIPKGKLTWLPWSLAAAFAGALIIIGISGVVTENEPHESNAVVRTTIDLPEGTQLSSSTYRRLKWQIRNELAISPNGQTLVFSAVAEEANSTVRLYRREMDQTEAEPIPGTEGASSPFFSPDGKWVAFWSEDELRKVSLDGGLPIALAGYRDPVGSFPYMGGCWSSDDTIFIGTHMNGLQTVSANGGQLERLTTEDRTTEYGHRMPQVLPGGRAVLFTVAYGYLGARGHIEVLSLDTGERKVVVDAGLDGRYVRTGHLLYLHQGTMMAAPFDSEQLEVTGHPVPVLEGVLHATNLTSGWANSGAGLFTVSENGTLVYAPGGMAPDRLYGFVWVDLDGKTQPVSGLPELGLGVPRVSPDGLKLAFKTGGLNSHFWIQDLVRGAATRLTKDGRADFFSWTPDSKRIVAGYSLGGVTSLYWLYPNRSGPIERITTSDFTQQPGSMTPDGRYLAYVLWRHSTGSAIWILDLSNLESTPILDTENDNAHPDFSPDGRWLAYTSTESERSEVWVMSFPGGEQRVQVSIGDGRAPLWSPDGHKIYYRSRTDLMAVDVTSGSELTLGKPYVLFKAPWISTNPIRGYDITPDGERFIFWTQVESDLETQSVRQLRVVLNWFEELNRLSPSN